MGWGDGMLWCAGEDCCFQKQRGNKLHTPGTGRRESETGLFSLYTHLREHRTWFTEWSPTIVPQWCSSVCHRQRVQSGHVLQILSPTDTLTEEMRLSFSSRGREAKAKGSLKFPGPSGC